MKVLDSAAETILNLRHIVAFYEVGKCSHLSEASRRINLSQPAVTHAIAKLEREAGTQLFHRRSSGLALSEPGVLFWNRVESGLDHLSEVGTLLNSKPNFVRQISFSQLRSLISTVHKGGIGAAAKHLNLSHSTVARNCRSLEQLIAKRLFEQTSNGLRPTHQAETLAKQGNLAFSEFMQGWYEMKSWKGALQGTLKIGSLPFAQARILPKTLAQFLEEYPRVEVSVIEGAFPQLVKQLQVGDLDFLIGALREEKEYPELTQEFLFSDPLAVVAGKGHPLANKANIALSDLAGFAWVVPRQGSPARAIYEHLFRDISQDIAAPVETGSQVVLRGLLTRSDRLSLISKEQMNFEIESGELEALDVQLDDNVRPLGFYQRKRWRCGHVHDAFIKFLKETTEGYNAE